MLVYDLQSVTKVYSRQARAANQAISLQIHQGEIFGILGDNGAGKTTLVRQMVNLLQPTSGSITLFGKPVNCHPLYAARTVGYMAQDANALNNLTVGEALYFTAHLRGLSSNDARRDRDQLLDLWQINALRDKNSARLSGGERRLLRLAVAMSGLMPILILDEPTNDLAPQRRRLVWEVLRQVNQERSVTIIFITHDALEAERAIQRVAILHEGRLVALGAPSELKQAVDQKLRLEMVLPLDCSPNLPADFTPQQVQPGRWLAWVERTDVGALLNQVDLAQFDDFRLYSATLEDLYVHYATQESH